MKKFLITNFLSFAATIAYSQVGIGVTENDITKEELQINGNLIISNKVGQLNKLEDLTETKTVDGVLKNTEYRIVAHEPNLVNNIKGQIKELSGNQNILPVVIQPYHVKNINGDDLDDLNLNIPVSDYFVAITNFEAIDNFEQGFPAIGLKGRFEYKTFKGLDNMWHLKMGNPSVSPTNLTNAFDYKFDIIIYPNRFFKNMDVVSYDLKGSNSGSASTPIID